MSNSAVHGYLATMLPYTALLTVLNCWLTWKTCQEVSKLYAPLVRPESSSKRTGIFVKPSVRNIISVSSVGINADPFSPRSDSQRPQPRLPRSRQKLRKLMSRTGLLSGSASICFSMSTMLRLVRAVIEYVKVMGQSQKNEDLSERRGQVRKHTSMVMIGITIDFFLYCAYISVLCINFLRLCTTFANSAYRLSSAMVHCGYLLILFSVITSLSVVILFPISPLIASMIGFLSFTVFVGLNVWIIWQFFDKSSRISRKMAAMSASSLPALQPVAEEEEDDEDDDEDGLSPNMDPNLSPKLSPTTTTTNHESDVIGGKPKHLSLASVSGVTANEEDDRNDNDDELPPLKTEKKSLQRAKALMDAALRLFLVILTALVSTGVLVALLLIRNVSDQFAVSILGSLMVPANTLVCSLCLLCTFQSQKSIYQWIFGRLHRYLTESFLSLR